MVNLFSFGCHVIDQAYVRTSLQIFTGGVGGDYQKERRGVSGVSWQMANPHLPAIRYARLKFELANQRLATS